MRTLRSVRCKFYLFFLWDQVLIASRWAAYRTQFPFTLSWAATVHSVQGLTIKPLALYMPHVWAWGQLYVAYSRAPTQRDLVLVQHVPRMDVRPEYQETARKVLAFLREAESRQEQMLSTS